MEPKLIRRMEMNFRMENFHSMRGDSAKNEILTGKTLKYKSHYRITQLNNVIHGWFSKGVPTLLKPFLKIASG